MQEGYYCGGSGAGGTEGMLVSKTSREWCGVEDWVQVTVESVGRTEIGRKSAGFVG